VDRCSALCNTCYSDGLGLKKMRVAGILFPIAAVFFIILGIYFNYYGEIRTALLLYICGVFSLIILFILGRI